jgi:hypothetical protein
MKKKDLVLAVFILLLQGCSTLNFTQQNIDRLHIGMSSSEVRNMFDAPDRVRVTTCGGKTSNPWTCEIWEYKTGSYRTNDFYFSVEGGNKLLTSWSVSK